MAKPRAQIPRPRRTSHSMQAPHYKILGRIASGGMGAVYLGAHAEDVGLSNLVAVKIIHEHLAENRVFTDMLLDEAQVAQRIHHPHVVGIVDVGEFLGRHFVVMPYIEGGTLSEMVRRHRHHLPTGLLMQVLVDALKGLHAAHSLLDDNGQSLGLVHRDISPGNIIIGTDGISRVIDFGVAKAASRITHTAPGTVKGKFSYMAPEQAMGESVDLRADVFSAGVVMWTVLTGKRLFTGKNSAHTIRNLMTAEVLPPSRIRPKVPKCYDEVCLKALQRNPDHRFQSAAEMAEALYTANLIAENQIAREEIGGWVSKTFEERIEHRRATIERLRSDPKEHSDEDLTFELDVDDLDGDEPLDNVTPATPSGRLHNPPSGILEQLGPDAPDFNVGRSDRLSSRDPHSGSFGSISSSLQGIRPSITPGVNAASSLSMQRAHKSESSSMLSRPQSRVTGTDSRPNIAESRSSISVVRRPSNASEQHASTFRRRYPLFIAIGVAVTVIVAAFMFRARLFGPSEQAGNTDPTATESVSGADKPVLDPVVIQVGSRKADQQDPDSANARGATATDTNSADTTAPESAEDTALNDVAPDPNTTDDNGETSTDDNRADDDRADDDRDDDTDDAITASDDSPPTPRSDADSDINDNDAQKATNRRRAERRSRRRNRPSSRSDKPAATSKDDGTPNSNPKDDKPQIEIPKNPYLDE